MNIWDAFFPVNKPIVIWGCGNNGQRWLSYLYSIGKVVEKFIDKDNSKNYVIDPAGNEVVVHRPIASRDGDETLLISCASGIEEIYEEAENLGYKRIIIGEALGFVPKNGTLTLQDHFPAFGHFYSLYPSFDDVDRYYDDSMNTEAQETDGIDLNVEFQISLLEKMNKLFPTKPEWAEVDNKDNSSYRYRKGNGSFGNSDAWALHFMLRLYEPSYLIEVGSGNSSAVALDTNEFYLQNSVRMEFIEPYPQLLHSILKPSDNVKISVSNLQDIPLEVFRKLKSGDFLFIDSTHVSKFHSDVNYLFFHILPALNPGVIVHIHDVFYPWEYPKEWIKKGMGWNEMYILRAFLQNNSDWEVLFYNHFMAYNHKDLYCKEWKSEEDLGGGSFWMRKKI